MSCVRGSKGSGRSAQLIEAMLSEAARARHTQRVIDLLRAELGAPAWTQSSATSPSVDAVCLQEVDRELLAAIRTEAASIPGWSVHANATAHEPGPPAASGRCSAITAIVTRAPPLLLLPDVVVEVGSASSSAADPSSSSKKKEEEEEGGERKKKSAKVRRHAALVLSSGVILISVHVRHCTAKPTAHSAQPSNAANIAQTERAVLAACRGVDGGDCGLIGTNAIAVGDWNGSVSGEEEVEGWAVRRCSPQQPTQFGKPLPVDGAAAFSSAAAAALDVVVQDHSFSRQVSS